MNETRRTSRVASLIRDEVARLVVFEISDPRLVGISITDVEVSRDLSQATVYYVAPATSEAPKEIPKTLERAIPFFRRHLGRILKLRVVPELRFEWDNHPEQVFRLMHLLESHGEDAGGESGAGSA